MALNETQRAWLDKAIQVKGKFTARIAVRKQLDVYIRRREKTAKAVAALPSDHPAKAQIDTGLKDADNLAKNGRLKDAYQHLETIKVLAKTSASARGALIAVDNIRTQADALARDFGEQVMECKAAVAGVEDLFGMIKVAPKAGDCATFEDAMAFREDFVAEEVRLRGLFTAAHTECDRIGKKVTARDLKPRIDQLATDIAAVKATDAAKDVATYEGVLKKIEAQWGSKANIFNNAYNISSYAKSREMELEELLSGCKSFGDLQSRKGEGVTEDDKTEGARSGLRQLTKDQRKALLDSEEKGLKRAREELKKRYEIDEVILASTDTPHVGRTPELPSFVPDTVFDDLGGGVDVSDVIADQDSKAIATSVADKIKTFATNAETDRYELFDLTLKSKGELRDMIARDVLGTTNPEDMTPTQISMLDQAVAEAEKSLAENLPNRIEPDATKVTVGGVEYKNPVVLKEGGNGKATRYTDDLGNSVVVKTLLRGNENERKKMVREMETHMRAMSGRDPNAPDDAIVEMKGAARSEDGSLHMILEDVKGGDLDDLTNGMAAATKLGLIPEAARQAIAMNNMLDTVKALKDLERQGLVHHDLKGENVMMTRDGKIKIIDFGESGFVGDDGTLGDHEGATTAGYEAKEAIRLNPDRDTKVDLYSMSGMLQRMVGGISPSKEINDKKMTTGALGRLVGALSDPDPKKRPSIDAILCSSLAASYEQDYNPLNVKDLQAASLEFSMQAVHVEGPVDIPTISGDVSPGVAKLLTDPMKLKNAQQFAVYLEGNLVSQLKRAKDDPEWYRLKGGDETIKQLQSDIAVIQSKVVNPMLEEAVDEAETAYADLLKDPDFKLDIPVGTKAANVTLQKAVQTRDEISARVQAAHDKAMVLLNGQAETDDLRERVEAFNAEITRWDEVRKGIDAAIYAAVGPKAKFFLAKVKMEKAAEAFGSVADPETEREEDPYGLNQLIKSVTSKKVHEELEGKAAN